METLKWKFTKSKRTGRYILYHPARHDIKTVDTREEAIRLRNELNLLAKCGLEKKDDGGSQ